MLSLVWAVIAVTIRGGSASMRSGNEACTDLSAERGFRNAVGHNC